MLKIMAYFHIPWHKCHKKNIVFVNLQIQIKWSRHKYKTKTSVLTATSVPSLIHSAGVVVAPKLLNIILLIAPCKADLDKIYLEYYIIIPMITSAILHIILKGVNIRDHNFKIIEAVSKYILDSNRFT